MADTSLRVLVVDDCPDTRKSSRLLLGLWGHDVREAADGPAALKAADSFLPEVVLLDLGLPGMDGCEVARQLRQMNHLGRPLLVAVTGYGRESDAVRARETGFDLLLVKPVEPQQLKRLLDCQQPRPPVGSAAPALSC